MYTRYKLRPEKVLPSERQRRQREAALAIRQSIAYLTSMADEARVMEWCQRLSEIHTELTEE